MKAAAWMAGMAMVWGAARAMEVGEGFRVVPIGPSSRFEAAAVADLNGDGRPDIFCGGFWYEAPSWTPHFVREVEARDGYHLDFGAIPLDLNGDGHTDIVGATWHNRDVYWLNNSDRAGEPWKLRTVDTPGNIETVLAADLDGDGRPDILPNVVGTPAWYSWRPDPEADGGVRWTRHPLPGQVGSHGLGVGDVDGDGRPEVITGKRYYAHNGKDPGAEDPRCVHAYSWDRNRGTWARRTLAHGGPVGFGISTKADDIDGDVDLICPGKSGLYLIENLGNEASRRGRPSPDLTPISPNR